MAGVLFYLEFQLFQGLENSIMSPSVSRFNTQDPENWTLLRAPGMIGGSAAAAPRGMGMETARQTT
tara:strand:- start:194 stop:391 length:198 start_codon:yes stop_codon:yes gene_type:complete